MYTFRMKRGKKLSWEVFWRMIGPSFRGTAFRYAGIFALIVIAALAQVAEPVIFGRIVDAIFAGTDNLLLRAAPIIAVWVCAFVVSIVVSHLAQWLSWRIGHRVNLVFFRGMMERIVFWDPDRFGRESSGAIAKRIDQAWERSYDISARILVDISPQIIGFVVVLATGLVLNWKMTIASLVTIPIVALLTLRVYVRTNERQDRLGSSWEALSFQMHEMLSNILPIKIFSGESRTLKALDDRAKTVAERQIAIDKVWGALGAANGLIRLCARLIIVVFGIVLIGRGEISLGVLTAFLGMLNQLLSPFDYLLADVLRRARRTQSAFARLAIDWTEENKIIEHESPVRMKNAAGAIEFKNVSYRYAGKTRDALRDVSFSVPAGTSLALVGRSGSGKSTLVKFVNRFLDPTEGSVLIDGIDSRSGALADIRRAVGVVQQDTVLFNETILNNVRFANPRASKSEVIAACKAAQAHEFIQKLPKGYATLVGERGVRLSGGERQRISLARVFLANPPIVILDESTSALDSETESRVQEALSRLMRGRTTIVIAHRLSTVYMADRIVVLDSGTIAEMGTHEQLLKKGGMYNHLWRLQSGGYLPE